MGVDGVADGIKSVFTSHCNLKAWALSARAHPPTRLPVAVRPRAQRTMSRCRGGGKEGDVTSRMVI